MVGPTMNLISRTHHSCERREHAFMVLREYTIISPYLPPTPFTSAVYTVYLYNLYLYALSLTFSPKKKKSLTFSFHCLYLQSLFFPSSFFFKLFETYLISFQFFTDIHKGNCLFAFLSCIV